MSVATKIYRFKYNLKYSRQLQWQRDSPTILIHAPKTGGMSISRALGYKKDPGHFTFKQHVESKKVPVERVVVAVRDPVERLKSMFKYARKDSQGSILAPLKLLRKFDSLQAFVESPLFDTFVEDHYFFRPQYHFAQGVFTTDLPVFFVRTTHLAADSKLAGIDNIEQINKSPEIQDQLIELDSKAIALVKSAYEVDEIFLDKVRQVTGFESGLN